MERNVDAEIRQCIVEYDVSKARPTDFPAMIARIHNQASQKMPEANQRSIVIYCDPGLRNSNQASTSADNHARRFEDTLIGRGNWPFAINR